MNILGLNFDNTGSVKAGNTWQPIPEVPRGGEEFQFEIGQECESTAIGVYKPGVRFIIRDRWMQHGYAYYEDTKGVRHRTKDIQAVVD